MIYDNNLAKYERDGNIGGEVGSAISRGGDEIIMMIDRLMQQSIEIQHFVNNSGSKEPSTTANIQQCAAAAAELTVPNSFSDIIDTITVLKAQMRATNHEVEAVE